MRMPIAICLWLATAPAMTLAQSGCGYVSTSTKPPVSKEIYPAAIRQIDGKDVDGSKRIKLTLGVHKIAVQERIADERRGNTKLRKLGNKQTELVLKVLEVDVKADGNYLIGAQLYEDRIDPAKPNDYWEPVVWRTTLDSCG
ncbi:MAG: hypothetical protein IPK27_11225 [Rhodanobacteraceae bacterium]|nr:hypothetical protein [Rhodanobacteraceae bacterium]